MILASIIGATTLAGIASVLVAMWLSFSALSRLVPRMVSLSAGLLLGTAVLHLLPESIESGGELHALSWTLLGGLLGFFLLEKFSVLRHSHHHEGDGHHHHPGHDHAEAGPGGLLILVGDSIHNFTDGVLIAAAFVADPALGWMTAIALAAHEIPQEVGDFIVLLNAGYTRRRAIAFNLLSGAAAVVGGVVGYLALSHAEQMLPYLLMLAASGFIYIALADLVPGIQKENALVASALQVGLMFAGVAAIATVTSIVHAH